MPDNVDVGSVEGFFKGLFGVLFPSGSEAEGDSVVQEWRGVDQIGVRFVRAIDDLFQELGGVCDATGARGLVVVVLCGEGSSGGSVSLGSI